MRELKQNQTANVMVLMIDSIDHITGKTGLTLAVEISKDGGAFATETGNVTVTERGNGWYSIAITGTHTNTLGDLVVSGTSAGADPGERISVVVANIESDTYAKVPSGNIADYKADTTGLATEASIQGVSGDIVSLDSDIADIATDLADIDLELDGLATEASIESISGDINIIKGTGFDTDQHSLTKIKQRIG